MRFRKLVCLFGVAVAAIILLNLLLSGLKTEDTIIPVRRTNFLRNKDLSDQSLFEYLKENPFNKTSLKLYTKFPKSDNSSLAPRMVAIITYQRSGSSFFGKIFDRNPNAFYVYEPLDSLYSSIYGTAEAWNVPSDITSHWNGSERFPPKDDIEDVQNFLFNLLQCIMDQLPTEFFQHIYWAKMTNAFQTGEKAYASCIRKLRSSVFSCRFIPGSAGCPAKIGGEFLERQAVCKQQLRNASAEGIFREYQKCNMEARKELEKCIPILQRNCTNAQMRVTKTVRVTMQSVELLLAKDPDIRVIQLVRDPRAVVLSRMTFHSTRGTYSGDSRIKESQIFCRSVVRDLRLFKELQRRYPGRLIQVVYDDFVRDPIGYTKAVYDFIGTEVPPKTLKWLQINTKGKRNSTDIASKWQTKLRYGEVQVINNNCKEYMSEIPFPWP